MCVRVCAKRSGCVIVRSSGNLGRDIVGGAIWGEGAGWSGREMECGIVHAVARFGGRI